MQGTSTVVLTAQHDTSIMGAFFGASQFPCLLVPRVQHLLCSIYRLIHILTYSLRLIEENPTYILVEVAADLLVDGGIAVMRKQGSAQEQAHM